MKRCMGPRRWPLVTAVVLLSCGDPEPAPPADLIPRETFTEVLAGAYLVEARSSLDRIFVAGDSSVIDPIYDSLFSAHGVTLETFKTTFQYYNERPKEFKAIHDEVVVELGRRRDGQR